MNWWHNIEQTDAQYYKEIAQSLGCEDKVHIEHRPATVEEIIHSAHKGVGEALGRGYEPDPQSWSFFASDDVDKKLFMNKYDGF